MIPQLRQVAVIDDDRDFCLRAQAAISGLLRSGHGAWKDQFDAAVWRVEPSGAGECDFDQFLARLRDLRAWVETGRGDLQKLPLVPTDLLCDAYIPMPNRTVMEFSEEVRDLVSGIHLAWEEIEAKVGACPLRVLFWSRDWERLGTERRRHETLTHDPDTHEAFPWARFAAKPDFSEDEGAAGRSVVLVARQLRGQLPKDPDLPEVVFAGAIGSRLRAQIEGACKQRVTIIVCVEDEAREQAVNLSVRLMEASRTERRSTPDFKCEALIDWLRELAEREERTRCVVELPPAATLTLEELELIVTSIEQLADRHCFVISLPTTGAWDQALRKRFALRIVRVPPIAERAVDLPKMVMARTHRAMGDPDNERKLVTNAGLVSYKNLFLLLTSQATNARFGTQEDWSRLGIRPEAKPMIVSVSGQKALEVHVRGGGVQPRRVGRVTDRRNFCAIMCVLAMAERQWPHRGVFHIPLNKLKAHADRLQTEHPALYPSKLDLTEFPDRGRIREALSALFLMAGHPSAITDVTATEGLLRVHMGEEFRIEVEWFGAAAEVR